MSLGLLLSFLTLVGSFGSFGSNVGKGVRPNNHFAVKNSVAVPLSAF